MKSLILAIILAISLLIPRNALAHYELYGKTLIHPSGLRMCLNKKDKPKQSKIHKKWHVDRECCLDPYEKPNPHCYYGANYKNLLNKYYQKYGK